MGVQEPIHFDGWTVAMEVGPKWIIGSCVARIAASFRRNVLVEWQFGQETSILTWRLHGVVAYWPTSDLAQRLDVLDARSRVEQDHAVLVIEPARSQQFLSRGQRRTTFRRGKHASFGCHLLRAGDHLGV